MRCGLNSFTRFAVATIVVLSLAGCGRHNTNAQTQEEKDQKTRQQVADATAKAKQESQVAAKNLDEAAHQAAHEAKVAAQGAKDGWNRHENGSVNLNSASKDQLEALPGLSASQSAAVIRNRPYNSPHDLVTKGIISEDEYQRIAGRLKAQ